MAAGKIINLERGSHNGVEVVKVIFDFDWHVIDQIKKIDGMHWNREMKYWYISRERFDINHLSAVLPDYFLKNNTNPDSRNIQYDKKRIDLSQGYLEKLEQKRYSKNTKKTYINYFRDFIIYFGSLDPGSVTKGEINNYILGLIRARDISTSQQNQRINAIKFYYEKVLGREKQYYDIERPRKESRLPDVLDKREVGDMLRTTINLKHSFVTHHLEQGTDLRYIQAFLGHKNSKTNERYTHVSSTKFSNFHNPIDDLLTDDGRKQSKNDEHS